MLYIICQKTLFFKKNFGLSIFWLVYPEKRCENNVVQEQNALFADELSGRVIGYSLLKVCFNESSEHGPSTIVLTLGAINYWIPESVTDPGFLREWGHQPQRWERQLIIWQNICRKLHENERNWIEREGGRVSGTTPPPKKNRNTDVTPSLNYHFCSNVQRRFFLFSRKQ